MDPDDELSRRLDNEWLGQDVWDTRLNRGGRVHRLSRQSSEPTLIVGMYSNETPISSKTGRPFVNLFRAYTIEGAASDLLLGVTYVIQEEPW